MRGERGQASGEYAGVVLLVAVVLAAAGAVAAPELPREVAHHLRVALCIVGGDVCRGTDAAAEGLEPCVVRVRDAARRSTVSLLLLKGGTHAGFAIEQRSDGSSRVSFTDGSHAGAAAEAGVRLGAHVGAGAGAGGEVGWTGGAAWELPDDAALRRLLAGVRQRPGRFGFDLARKRLRPSEIFESIGQSGTVAAGAEVGSLSQPLLSSGGRHALGRRVRGDGETSWFYDASRDGTTLFGGLLAEVSLTRPSGWTLEASRHELRFRSTRAARTGEIVEIEAALPLPANAALARELLARPSRAAGRRLLEAGVVERRVYRVEERPSDLDVAVKLGVAGIEHEGTAQERTLVAAEVLRPGGSARRADCLAQRRGQLGA